MSISFEKFIDITSGVVAATAVGTRQFVLRVFSANPLIPVGGVLSFTSLTDVATTLGTASEEYARASLYFDYVSPTGVAPKSIQFVRWVNIVSVASIYGTPNSASSLTTLKTIVAGLLTFNIGGTVVPVVGINLSAATSLAQVATILQTALNANANPVLATSTVTYDATNGRFVFKGAAAQTQSQTFALVAAGAGVTDVATNLAWNGVGALVSPPSPVVTPVNALIASVSAQNNFGSFLFTDSGTGVVPALADITALATQNKSYNVKYRYCVNVKPETYVAVQQAIGGIGGCDITYELDTLNQFPEMIPAIILAGTDFTAPDGTQGYMYQQFSTVTPSVTDDTTHDALTALNINFYGQTQVDGQFVSFYMEGVECGGSTDPRDMNVYSNEMWLKDFAGVTIFNYVLAVIKVPANQTGLAAIRALFTKDIIPAAVPTTGNGTFSAGKTLTDAQIATITSITANTTAYQNVQKYGYYLTLSLASTTTNGVTKWSCVYTLIYAKDDLIRTVTGTHSLV